jgi:hypothetical protein
LAAEMRFFKTHGFVKPLLREMLFRNYFIPVFLCIKTQD